MKPLSLNAEGLRAVREWAATPPPRRTRTRYQLAMQLRVSENTITRAANARYAYAKAGL